MSEATKPAPSWYGVDTRLDGNTLTCDLIADPSRTDGVIWTLHRGDFDPQRASKPVEAGGTWQVRLPDSTGGFAVRATVDGVTHQSAWLQGFSKDAVARYEAWRASWVDREIDLPVEIPLYRYEEPFDNIAFVCHSDQRPLDELRQFAEANGLMAETHEGVHWPQLTVLSGAGSAVDATGTRYVFSGITRDRERLLFGCPDVQEHVPDVRQLRDEVGEFHLLTWNEDQITFGHDYIGQSHLFYFENDELFVAANGLHLLALTLRSLGVELTLDGPTAKGKFFSTSYPFETHHGAQTDFSGIRRVPVYDSVAITPEGAQLVKTQLWYDDMDGEFSEEVYEELFAQAKRDIIDNVRIALEHPRFENVVVELSAGLDTRIIYNALTNLPLSNKVRIATRAGAEQETAAMINNLYGFAWDDLPKAYSFDSAGDADALPATSHSVFMDGYYIESMFKARQNYSRPTLVLTGHGGEAFSRVMSIEGYFGRSFSGELPGPVERIEDVFSNLFRYVGNHQVWLAAGEQWFTQTLQDCLDASPSDDFAKRFADIYVSERNPFIGGSVFRGAMSAPQWRPLQSKALYRLKALWFQHHQDFRLQFDLIRGLNPLISEVPYLKPVEYARLWEFHSYRAPFSLTAPIEFDGSVESLEDARARGARASTWVPDRSGFNETRARTRRYEDTAESFLEPLKAILQLAPEFEDMGLPLYTYIERVINRTNPKAFSKRHNVRNKLHILLQEVLLSVGSRPAAAPQSGLTRRLMRTLRCEDS